MVAVNLLTRHPAQITQPAGDFIIDHLPWLVGSIGTVTLDVIIFCQFLCYGNGSGAASVPATARVPTLVARWSAVGSTRLTVLTAFRLCRRQARMRS